MGIEILYEDNHLLIAVKPPNVPVQKDIKQSTGFLTLLRKILKSAIKSPEMFSRACA